MSDLCCAGLEISSAGGAEWRQPPAVITTKPPLTQPTRHEIEILQVRPDTYHNILLHFSVSRLVPGSGNAGEKTERLSERINEHETLFLPPALFEVRVYTGSILRQKMRTTKNSASLRFFARRKENDITWMKEDAAGNTYGGRRQNRVDCGAGRSATNA